MSCRISENVTNNEATALVTGEIVRINTNNGVVRSQADSTGNLQGTVGVAFSGIAAGATGPIMTLGRGTVRLAAGLVAPAPAAGQFIYADPTAEGRGTNVEPVNALIVGVIKDAANYGIDSTVIADVSVQWEVSGGAAGAANQITENVTNNELTPLVIGEIVKINADNGVIRSRANTAGAIEGTVGVAFAAVGAGAVGAIMTLGRGAVRMAAGLVAPAPAAGQYIWVDPATEGRGTNLQPATHGIVVGVIKDAANYGIDSTVIADVSVQWGIPAQLDRVVIGENANASGANAVAIGESSSALGTNSVALGFNATSNAGNAVVIGDTASAAAAATLSVAIGPDASTSVGLAAIAIGSSAAASAADAIAVGNNAVGSTEGSIAVGSGALSDGVGEGSVAIGGGAVATSSGEGTAIAIGQSATCTGSESLALGEFSDANVSRSVAIGANAQALGSRSVVIGYATTVTAAAVSGAIVIGSESAANGNDTIVIGRAGGNLVNAGADCVLIGPAPTIPAPITGGIGIGQGITIGSEASIVIGRGASQTGAGSVCIAIGDGAATTGAVTGSIAIGADAAAAGGIALGVDSISAGGIAIGNDSVGGTNLCAIGGAGAVSSIEDFNVRNNLGSVNTLRAQAVPSGGNNVTGLWICIRSQTGSVSLQQVTLTAADPGVLQVANA